MVRIWDTAAWTVRTTLSAPLGATRLLVAPDGRWLTCLGAEKVVRIWDTESWELRGEVDCVERVETWVAGLDSTWLATASRAGTIRIWDVAAIDGPVAKRDADINADADARPGCVVLPGSSCLAIHATDRIEVYDIATGRTRWSARDVAASHRCAAAPDGSWLIRPGPDGTPQVRDSLTGQVRAELLGHDGAVTGCAVSSDGSWLITSGMDGTLRRWDTMRWQLADVLVDTSDSLAGCLLAPDSSWLIFGASDGLYLWDLVEGRVRVRLAGESIDGVTIAPDGSWIGTCRDGKVWLWDAATGQQLATAGWHGSLRYCLAGPNGRWVGVVGTHANQYGRTADIIPLGRWNRGGEWGLWTDDVVELSTGDLVASPDGRFVATTDVNGPVRIWDTTTWQAVTATWVDDEVVSCGWLPGSDGLWVLGARGVEMFDFTAY